MGQERRICILILEMNRFMGASLMLNPMERKSSGKGFRTYEPVIQPKIAQIRNKTQKVQNFEGINFPKFGNTSQGCSGLFFFFLARAMC